jgi:hypothetical protein
MVRLAVNSEQDGCAADARLVDLRIRSGGEVVGEQASAPSVPQKSRWQVWLVLALLATLALLLGGGLLLRRRRRGGGKTAAPVGAAATVSFACSGCGKGLKARAQLVGKEVHCPGCRAAVIVPAARAASIRGSASES